MLVGLPWRSRIRNRISPCSRSVISLECCANDTRAELTTDRSSAMQASSRTKPWSSTSMRSAVVIGGCSTVAMFAA